MLRLPDGVTWLHVGAFVLAIGGGFYVDREYSDRKRLLASLDAYAVAHPEGAGVAGIVASCNRSLIVDAKACGEKLLSAYGPSSLEMLGRMHADGAFNSVER